MGGIEDNHWVDMFIDEIGIALNKVDKSIQKSIELWAELTKDIFDKQHTQNSTGQPNKEEQSSQDKPAAHEVKERPIQHWSMCLSKVKEKASQHWAMCASKIPETLIQEQGDDDYYDGDGDGDGDGEEEEDETTVSESGENMWELDLRNAKSSDVATSYHHYCEEDSGSSLKWKGGYQLLKNADMSSEDDDESWDDDDDDDEEITVSESCEDDDESWDDDDDDDNDDDDDDEDDDDDDDDEEDETTVSESCEDDDSDCDDEDETTHVSESSESMWELNLVDSGTSYTPSSYHHQYKEDRGSSLKWTVGYQLLKKVDTSSEEDDESWDDDDDEVEESHSDGVEGVPEMLREHSMSDVSNESLMVHDDEDDVSDKLQGFVDVRQEDIGNNTDFGEVETLFPESDWVYVTRD